MEIPKETTELIVETLDDVVLVSGNKIKTAIRYFALENNLVTEGADAISVAAALGMSKQERGKYACILTGGSIDAEKLSKILTKLG